MQGPEHVEECFEGIVGELTTGCGSFTWCLNYPTFRCLNSGLVAA